ncbi:MAG: DUF58 domain-containing protein [Actinomycetota bacterium]
MPTRRGRALLVAGVLCYPLARATAVRELYAISLAALLLQGLASAFVVRGRHHITCARALEPARSFAGGTLRLRLTATSTGRISSPPLMLEDDLPIELGGPVRVAIPGLHHGHDMSVVIERRARARGRHVVGPMRARLTDPFGLASVAREVVPATTLVVYPYVETLGEQEPPERRGGSGRLLASRLSAAGDEMYAVRGWQEGDDLRKIHWRSTARRNELMIRQDEVRPHPRATILVDTRGSVYPGGGGHVCLEWAISAAATLVWELARDGFALRVATADGPTGSVRWGREAADPLLTALAMARRSSRESPFGALRKLGTPPAVGGALVAIMPPPSPEVAVALAGLASSFNWCGAVLLDTLSFRQAQARERTLFDQRLAESQNLLGRAGWNVAVAGAADRFPTIWKTLLNAGVSHPSSRLRRS